jgi:hypothetical protein
MIGNEVYSKIHHSIEFKDENTSIAKCCEHPSSAIDNAVKHEMLTNSLLLIDNNWVAWAQYAEEERM